MKKILAPVLALVALAAGGCKPLGSFGQGNNGNTNTIVECVSDVGCNSTPATPMCTGGYCTGSCGSDADCQNIYDLPSHFKCSMVEVNGQKEHRCREKCQSNNDCPVAAPSCQAGFCFPTVVCTMSCAAGTICQNGTCVPVGSGGLGSACGGSNPACAAGLICTSRNLCSDRSIGQPCTLANECSTGACINNTCQKCTQDVHCPGSTCNLATGVCNNATMCGAGQTLCSGVCSTTSSDPANCGGCGVKCGANQTCNNGVCGNSLLANGSACNAGNQCQSGFCSSLGRCSDKSNGASCGNVGDCTSGICQNGVCGGGATGMCKDQTGTVTLPIANFCCDNRLDGDETGPDCGGSCNSWYKCGPGLGCRSDADCNFNLALHCRNIGGNGLGTCQQ